MKTILTILVLLAAIISGVYFANRYSDTLSDLSALRGEYSKTVDTAKQYKDRYGATHAILEVNNMNHAASMLVMGKTIDSQAKRLNIKPNQLTSVSSFTVHKTGQISFTVEQLDSMISAAQRSHKDRTDTFNIEVPIFYTNSIDMHYNEFWKRKWFLGNKRHFADLYSEDTSVRIYKFKSQPIGDKYSQFGGSVTLGLTVPTLQPVLVVGVSWQPDFMRFKKRK